MRQIVVPFMSFVPAVVISFIVVGPIGWAIGSAIVDAVRWAPGSLACPVTGAVEPIEQMGRGQF